MLHRRAGEPDIAEAARPKEYETARLFFAALADALALPRASFVFLLGNHDVSWTSCERVEGALRDEEFLGEELRDRLDAAKLERFDAMVHHFYADYAPTEPLAVWPLRPGGQGPARPPEAGAVTALARGAYVHDFPALQLSVAALNSCELESHRPEDHRGMVSGAQAQAVLDHWRSAPPDRLRLLAVHHNPVPSPPDVVKEWAEWLRQQTEPGLFEIFAADVAGFEGTDRLQALVSDAQVSLVFHGHHHVADAVQAWAWRGQGASGDARVISAGSWGLAAQKLPRDQPVVMQLVRVTEAQVQPVLLRYEPRARSDGHIEPGAFVLDEATRRLAPLQLSIPEASRLVAGAGATAGTSAPGGAVAPAAARGGLARWARIAAARPTRSRAGTCA
ncbi:MAG: metallophosphoesterase [Myxococcales bacterium]|nr:metallophosphoesterase [Myxococcales bacterium]